MTTPAALIRHNAPLGDKSWFGTGGGADVLFEAKTKDDLIAFLKDLSPDTPITLLGGMSNVLIRDGGVRGVVIRLGAGFAGIERLDDRTVRLGAACRDMKVADASALWGLSGFEFLCGIPGWLGGAVAMNAGASGSCLADVFVSATALDRAGHEHHITARDLAFGYRTSGLPAGMIVIDVTLRGTPSDPDSIKATLAAQRAKRKQDQPVNTRTGGSTFKNPHGHSAWSLIDAAGLRGYRIGAAQISEKHTNFLVNLGGATSSQLEALGEHARKTVYERTGINLSWEIQRLGDPL
jgi:UDP-N-acetylmuramate dehydrogenase